MRVGRYIRDLATWFGIPPVIALFLAILVAVATFKGASTIGASACFERQIRLSWYGSSVDRRVLGRMGLEGYAAVLRGAVNIS